MPRRPAPRVDDYAGRVLKRREHADEIDHVETSFRGCAGAAASCCGSWSERLNEASAAPESGPAADGDRRDDMPAIDHPFSLRITSPC
jgi:hypothetical protein